MLNHELPKPVDNRPAGAVVLAGLLLLTGLFIIWDRATTIINAHSLGAEIIIHPPYYVDRTMDAVTAITAIVAAAGLVTRGRWGWYIAAFHLSWRLASEWILPILSSLITGIMNASSTKVVPALILVIALAYLFGKRVPVSFGVDPTERLRAMMMTSGLAISVAACFELLKVIVSDPLLVGPQGL